MLIEYTESYFIYLIRVSYIRKKIIEFITIDIIYNNIYKHISMAIGKLWKGNHLKENRSSFKCALS